MSQTDTSRKTLAFAALLLGAAAIAFAPIFVRLSDTAPSASAFWRVALALAPLWIWMRMSPRADRVRPLPWKPLLIAGLCFAGDLGAWHVSIMYTTVANSTLEANFAPIFVTLGAWILFRQRVSRLFLIALGVTLGGATLLIGPNFALGGRALLGDALGVLTAVFYAGYMLAIKSASERTGTAGIMAVSTGVAALALLPYALATADVFLPQSAAGWLVLIGLALIPHIAGQSLIAYGFAHLPAAFSSVSLLLQPVLAAIYAWALLGEAVRPVQMLGALVVLTGIYLARRGS
ncbi:MAG: DMT family transporter [Betaproteobacteria bacterium]|nr:DMT family transporter [Betaproteobacteria bacterium]